MKKRTVSLVAVSAAALLLAVLVGCPQPGWIVKRGALTVSINNTINARTLLPPIKMDATSYTVNGQDLTTRHFPPRQTASR